jgi:DNA-binding XRE family transcriptional regulator
VNKSISLRVGDREFLIGNWCKITGIPLNTLYGRVKAGWTPEEVIGEKERPRSNLVPRREFGPPKARENNLTEHVEIRVVKKVITKEVVDNEAIGQAAREIRIKAGLSLDQASDRLGISLGSLHKLEKGTSNWTAKKIENFNQVSKGWVNNDND